MNIFKFKQKKAKGMPGSTFRSRKTTTGFTLIELLVVISIIGFLSSIVLASLATARNKAKASASVSAMLQIKNAAELYRTSTGSYPTEGALNANNLQLIPTYLPSLPPKPFGANNYIIGFEDDNNWCGGKSYDTSQKENGKLYVYYWSDVNKIPTNLFSKYVSFSDGVVYNLHYDGGGSSQEQIKPCVE
jgi:prepilin-type N-terminal cleavage/methylation domain-containing protein